MRTFLPQNAHLLVAASFLAALPSVTFAVGPDFNGDGFDDLAIGIPFEDIGAVNAGAVQVIYGSASRLRSAGNQLWHQNNLTGDDGAQANDLFGSALAWGDFNGDGFDDLAIGIEGENIGSVPDAGAVYVLMGSSSGLKASGGTFWHQNTSGVVDACETDDKFGSALAVGDFNGDGRDDLAIGVPGESIGTLLGAGAVQVLYGSSTGLKATSNQLWHQNSTGILDAAEASDNFGDSLAAGDFNGDGRDDLAIGVEEEDVGTVNEAGIVHIVYGSSTGLRSAGNQIWHQNSTGILDEVEHFDHWGDSLAAGDFDGDGFADLAISVELEDLGGIADAGAVHVIYGSATGLNAAGNQIWTQNSSGIANAAEANDRFGSALKAGDFDNDGFDDLVIGVEDEGIGSLAKAGVVHVIYGSGAGLSASGSEQWHQNVTSVQDAAHAGDGFGDSFAVGDFNGDGRDDLAIGIPGENKTATDAGAVCVLYGVSGGLSAANDQFWHQNTSGLIDSNESGDQFGSVM